MAAAPNLRDLRRIDREGTPDDARANAADRLTERDAILDDLNRQFFVFDEAGTVMVGRETRDPITNRAELTRYSIPAFRTKTATLVMPDGKPAADEWLRWKGRREFDRVVFAPGRADLPADVLNLWRGWGVKAAPGNAHAPYVEHLREVICDGHERYFRYLWGWLATMMQHPDRPAGTAVIIRSGEGAGKTLAVKALHRIIGTDHTRSVSDPKHLVGAFNAHLETAILVEASESFFAGDKQHAARLKALITDDLQTIEKKGQDARVARNTAHLIATSNEAWVVPASADSRRFFVLDASDARRGDKAYFDRLARVIADDEAMGNLLHALLTTDLSAFNIHAVPTTKALIDQRERSMTGVPAWALDLAARGTLNAERGNVEWSTFFTTRDLHFDYAIWHRGQRYEGRLLSDRVLARELSRLGLLPARQDGKGKRGFAMPGTPEEFGDLVREKAGLAEDDAEL